MQVAAPVPSHGLELGFAVGPATCGNYGGQEGEGGRFFCKEGKDRFEAGRSRRNELEKDEGEEKLGGEDEGGLGRWWMCV